jgi:hypothetical protein
MLMQGNDSLADRDGPPGGKEVLQAASAAEAIEIGRRIYREGVGAGGAPIAGVRFGGVESSGAAVACVNCHRRSGMGAVEGTDQVSPIAGRFIFTSDPRAVASLNFRNIKSFNQKHAPYTDETFAMAVTKGTHQTGRDLSPIMPRYDFTAEEIGGIQAYLRTLSAEWSPGITARKIRFATVITPDVEPARRKMFIETIQAAVMQKNGNVVTGQRSMNAAEMLLRTDRRWDLDIWELTGTPDTWATQLDEHQRSQPAFALVSGLGDQTWEPVHDFCERTKVPCWFPSVDMPPARAKSDFYSVYFSRGIEMEADVLAKHVSAMNPKPARIVQLHFNDALGNAASAELRVALKALGGDLQRIVVEDRVLATSDANSLKSGFAKLNKRDLVVAWFKPEIISALDGIPVPAVPVYFSAFLANGELAPLPAAWRTSAHLIYPYQMPDKRGSGLVYFKTWLKQSKLELRDELLQSEVYFAMSYLGETVSEMLDNLHGEYLVERAENMLSLRESAKAEDEAREMLMARHQAGIGTQAALARLDMPESRKSPRPVPGRPEMNMGKRESTTAYPRLALAQGQRFASKGAYIVRFSGAEGTGLIAESDWIIP